MSLKTVVVTGKYPRPVASKRPERRANANSPFSSQAEYEFVLVINRTTKLIVPEEDFKRIKRGFKFTYDAPYPTWKYIRDLCLLASPYLVSALVALAIFLGLIHFFS